MKILITGSTGLLGSKLVDNLDSSHIIYPIFNNNESTHRNSQQIDITDFKKIEKTIIHIKPNSIIHAAAMTNVDQCEQNPELAENINHNATANIVKAAQITGSHLIFISTDYVFNGEKGNYSENDLTDPISVYGETKLAAEQSIQESEIESTIVRPSVVYGDKPSSGKTNFVLWVINQLQKGKQVSIIDDQIISPTYNQNLAYMIKEVAERKFTEVYHLSGATQINRLEFTYKIAKTFDLDSSLIKPVSSDEMNWVAMRPKKSSLNVQKAEKILHNKPESVNVSLQKLKTELTPL